MKAQPPPYYGHPVIVQTYPAYGSTIAPFTPELEQEYVPYTHVEGVGFTHVNRRAFLIKVLITVM